MNTASSMKCIWDITLEPDNNKLDLSNKFVINSINEFIKTRKIIFEQREEFNESFLGSVAIFEPFANNN